MEDSSTVAHRFTGPPRRRAPKPHKPHLAMGVGGAAGSVEIGCRARAASLRGTECVENDSVRYRGASMKRRRKVHWPITDDYYGYAHQKKMCMFVPVDALAVRLR